MYDEFRTTFEISNSAESFLLYSSIFLEKHVVFFLLSRTLTLESFRFERAWNFSNASKLWHAARETRNIQEREPPSVFSCYVNSNFSFHPRASTVFFVSLFSFIVLQYSETSACTGGWLQVAFVEQNITFV